MSSPSWRRRTRVRSWTRSGGRPTSARAWRRCGSRTRCRRWAALRTVSTAADQGWLAAPDNHFAASPDSGVTGSDTRCVCGAGGCPKVCCGIVSAAGAIGGYTPDDHFSAGPDCRVTTSGFGRVGSASRCPAICAWIVSRAVTEYVPFRRSHPRRSFHCQSRLRYETRVAQGRW
jgi:hypothetical protein